MSFLNSRLYPGALAICTAIRDAGGCSILVGGAAVIALGSSDRNTKDIDINSTMLTTAIVTALRRKGITVRPSQRNDRFSANIPESGPGMRDATGVDLAIKPNIAAFLGKYTKDIHGVTVADERLLLVDKIQCFGERSENQGEKMRNDLNDIMFCISLIEKEGRTVPHELGDLITPESWEMFWARLKDRADSGDFLVYKEYLKDVGLH